MFGTFGTVFGNNIAHYQLAASHYQCSSGHHQHCRAANSTDSHGTLYWPFKGPIGPQGPQGPQGPHGPHGAPEGPRMEPKWKFWNQNGTKIGFWEPKFDFWNQNGTKIEFLEPKWNQHLDFWNQNGTKILKYTEFLSKKRSHEFTPKEAISPLPPSPPHGPPWAPMGP